MDKGGCEAAAAAAWTRVDGEAAAALTRVDGEAAAAGLAGV